MWRVVILLLLASHVARAEDRVAAARKNQAATIKALFDAANVSYPPKEILLRAFKKEGDLELWAGAGGKTPLAKVTTFKICMRSGDLGPKRARGDGQVPEGFYKIERFNPFSNFHLSLGLNYPNEADKVLGSTGGDIYIHGSCVTIGCLPIRDEFIEQLYVIALDAKAAGKRDIPVHVFPRRLDENGMGALEFQAKDDPKLLSFWRSLQPAYELFEQTRRIPRVTTDSKTGAYTVAPAK